MEQRVPRQSCRIRLRLLGRCAVTAEGEPLLPLRISSKKGCALLAYLAMQPEMRIGREQLSAMLWGDRFDKQARQNLRQCLVSLRGDFGSTAPDLLILERDTVALRQDALDVDAREFSALAGSADVGELERAASLYQGEFFSDFSLDVEPFDEWLRGERLRLETVAVRLLETQASRSDALRRGQSAIDAAERLVAIDPLREDWQRTLLSLYARYRSPEAALAHAKVVADLLKSELDVEPDPATCALTADIRRGAIAPALPVTTQPDIAASAAIDAGSVTAPEDVAAVEPARPRASGLSAHIAAGASAALRTVGRPVAAALIVTAVVSTAVSLWLFAGGSQTPRELSGSRPAQAATDRSSVASASWASPNPPSGIASDRTSRANSVIVPVVVLPFTALAGGSPSDQAFAEAITDDLFTALSRMHGFRVIALQTAMHYKGRSADAAAIGKELDVRYLIDGSVRSQEGILWINVRLVDTTNQLTVWADRFERGEGYRIEVQEEIVRRLGRMLHIEVPADLVRRTAHVPIRDATIAELLAKASTANFRGPAPRYGAEARAYLEEALKRNPDFAPALVEMARHLVMGVTNFALDSKSSLERAEQLLDHAREVSPDFNQVIYWTGMLRKAQGRYDEALQLFERTIELMPSLPMGYVQTGSTLVQMGRAAEAMPHILYGIRLSPKDPTIGLSYINAWNAELEVGHSAAAIDWYRRSVAEQPQNPNVHIRLSAAYALTGDKANAADHLTRFRELAAPAAIDRLLRNVKQTHDGSRRRMRFHEGVELAFASSS